MMIAVILTTLILRCQSETCFNLTDPDEYDSALRAITPLVCGFNANCSNVDAFCRITSVDGDIAYNGHPVLGFPPGAPARVSFPALVNVSGSV